MTPETDTRPEVEAGPEPANRLSSRTTPTWEMELLVSGATVFGLMQLPAVADRWLFGLYNSTSPEVSMLVMPLWVYVQFSLLTLIATFIIHLFMRGYWVALAGLYSVYPKGIDWAKIDQKMGPHYRAVSHEMVGDMPTVIERADNRASRVFGVGFGMATTMLVPAAIVTLGMGVARLYRALSGTAPDMFWVITLVLLVPMLPFLALVLWDRQRGDRIAADSLSGRVMRRMYAAFAMVGFGRGNNPLITLFISNEGGGKTGALMFLTIAVAMLVVGLQVVSQRLGLGAAEYVGLPPNRIYTTDNVLSAHYASQRGDKVVLAPPPYIPDPLVSGPYLRLFVPFLPQRLTLAMERECPQALADRSKTGDRTRLDCLQTLYRIEIDGHEVIEHFDAGEDLTGQRGMVAMLPMRDLAEGRHELTILPPRRDPAGPRDAPQLPYRIPFWR